MTETDAVGLSFGFLKNFHRWGSLLGIAVVAAFPIVGSEISRAPEAQGVSGDLRIFLDTSNPAPRKTMEDMIARFQSRNPNLNIETTIIDREAYKTQIRNFLTANAPDVATWYAGNRMAPYVNAGLFEDVSDLWQGQLSDDLKSSRLAMTMDGKQWGVPYSYYQWGIYYRQDLYDRYGLQEPETWDQFKANCQTLLDNGIKCFTIGSKFLWTAGGWFDYLNSRVNGYDFHIALANGKVSWKDPRVRNTFAKWRELIDMGAYIDNHASYSWQESLPFLVNGQAGAILIGNFAVPPLREAGLDDSTLDFHQFPAITQGVALAEDAPMDTFHIPSQAQNKDAARAFLRYVADADNQTLINTELSQLPVNAKSRVGDDKFLQEGFAMLSTTSGIMQFFDRDFPAEMAKIGMEGLQEFMVKPDNLEAILSRLDRARRRIYR